MEIEEVFFESNNVTCAGDFYWPQNLSGQIPCLVMGHGGSGTKRLGLAQYAEKFVELGIAVFAFDYRSFGRSGGEPRQLLDIENQREDYQAAISFVRSHPKINPDKIALWGTSFSGGHVLAVAAKDVRIAAVISQAPLIDIQHRGRSQEEDRSWKIMKLKFHYIGAAAVDMLGSWFGRSPYFVPVYPTEPGGLAAFIDPKAKEAFEAMGGEASGWKNALAPRFFFKMVLKGLPRYVEGTAEKLTMPLLMCVADKDTEASASFAVEVASKAPNAVIKHYPISHFEAYLTPYIDQIIQDQKVFLKTLNN